MELVQAPLKSCSDSTVPLESGDTVLRVTTFNILAPVWTHQSIYPGMNMEEFEPLNRSKQQLKALKLLDSDIILMQECQKTELDQLMNLEDGFLKESYDVEFCPFPSTFWTNWLTDATNHEPRENGVCILTRKSVMTKLGAEHVPIDLPEWKNSLPESSLGARACCVTVEIPAWSGVKALIVTSHLDADSAYRAGLQGKALCRKLKTEESQGYDCIIWGGDFNMEWRNPALKQIRSDGFSLASQEVRTPTVYACMACMRVDHIFCSPTEPGGPVQLECLGTYVPTCPKGHCCCKVLPMLTELQWLGCSVKGEYGRCQQVVALILLLLLLPLLLLLWSPFIVNSTCGAKAQRGRVSWALETWGSDHLPVTVSIRGRAAQTA